MQVLVLDDQRIFKTLPGVEDEASLVLTHVTTTQDALSPLYGHKWDIVVLDHDLGMESAGSGTDLVNYIENRYIQFSDRPIVDAYYLCSFNPAGREYQRKVLEGIGERVYLIDPSDHLDYDEMDKIGRNPYLAGPRK